MRQAAAKAVRLVALARASVPVPYVVLGLEIAAERGLDRSALLRGTGLGATDLEQPEGRVSLAQCARLTARVVRQIPDPSALGYEFGLRSNLAAHGSLGYGLLSQRTVGEALAFGLKYGRLRNPILRLSLSTEGDQAVIEARPTLPLGPLRQYALDAVLIAMARIARQISGAFRPQLELRFDTPEPAHYARYRSRLPPVRFGAGANQLRFPAEYLERPLPTGNAASAQVITQQCERDLALLGEDGTLADRVRALLVNRAGTYPDLTAVAQRLHLSGRSLKRKLQQEGVGFLDLLEDARKRDSLQWLADGSLTVGEVATRVGYSDPASFTRAFRKWTGLTPSAWRERDA